MLQCVHVYVHVCVHVYIMLFFLLSSKIWNACFFLFKSYGLYSVIQLESNFRTLRNMDVTI